MFRIRARRHLLAFTLIEVMAATSIMSGLQSQGGYQYAINAANEVKGTQNLKQIYQMIMAQSMGGEMPSAAFYPKDDPKKDPKSIIRVMGQNVPAELFVSPFAPDGLKRKGLTFAWNDTVNGKQMDNLPKDTWLLVDLAAFIADPNIPKPHKYLVLYADGRAMAVAELPADIQKAVKEAEQKAKQSAPKVEK